MISLLPLPLLLAAVLELEQVERHLVAMGTSLEIALEAADRPVGLGASEAAVRAIADVEARLSTWSEDSELAGLNRAPVGVALPLSPELARDLRGAGEWRARTHGAFDPAVGALVSAWDLRGAGRSPRAEELAEAASASGFDLVELSVDAEGRTCAKRLHPDVALEEGGFGKGVGLDAALEAARAACAMSARIDLGGQVAWFGGGRPVGVAHPARRDEIVLELDVASTPFAAAGSLATSGNSERGLVVDGEPLGHLLDPRSGRPAPNFGSVTVLASDARTADCLSTALFVLGPDAGLAFALESGACEALFLETQGDAGLRARATPGLADALTPLSDDPSTDVSPGPVTVEVVALPPKLSRSSSPRRP